MKIDLEIRRFDPDVDRRPHWQAYELDMDETDRVLDCLHQVRWHHDGSLAFRRSCAHGVCGSDAMVINGVNRLACVVMVRDVGPRIRVEPLRGLPVLKDLLVDMDPFFEAYRAVRPWLTADSDPADGRERLQSPEQRARYDDTTKCILCAACTASCPVYWANDSYVGPAALVNAHRFVFDSRDEADEERLALLDSRDGVWACRTVFNCTDACPRGIKVTEAIQELKRARFSDED